jgi:ribose 5-phosphate isomerase B
MKVFLATDHTGFEIKNKVYKMLLETGYDAQDCGALTYNKDDDYPDFIAKAAREVAKDPTSRGVVFGGSGQGEAMAANKILKVTKVPTHLKCSNSLASITAPMSSQLQLVF